MSAPAPQPLDPDESLRGLAARANAAGRLRAAMIEAGQLFHPPTRLMIIGLANALESVPEGHPSEAKLTAVADALLGRTLVERVEEVPRG